MNSHYHELLGMIMCGGLGTRAEKMTRGHTTKHLLPVDRQRTIIDYPFECLAAALIEKIVLVTTNFTTQHIYDHFRREENFAGRYSVFEHDDPFMNVTQVVGRVLKEYGDQMTLVKCDADEVNIGLDMRHMLKVHFDNKHPTTYLATNGNGCKYKVQTDTQGLVTQVYHRPFEPYCDNLSGLGGVVVMDPSEFPYYSSAKTSLEYFIGAIKRHALYIYKQPNGEAINVNSAEDYQILLQKLSH